MELMGNELSNPSRLPGPKALMHGLMVKMLLGQQG